MRLVALPPKRDTPKLAVRAAKALKRVEVQSDLRNSTSAPRSIVRGMRTPGGWSVCNDRLNPVTSRQRFAADLLWCGQPSLCAGDGLEPGAVAVDDRGGVRGDGQRPVRQAAVTPEP
jgi:hypothetical protein